MGFVESQQRVDPLDTLDHRARVVRFHYGPPPGDGNCGVRKKRNGCMCRYNIDVVTPEDPPKLYRPQQVDRRI